MTKGTSKPGANWMVKVKERGEDGKILYSPAGKPLEVCIPMANACFANGHSQPLYFPLDHPTHPGLSKVMAWIPEEPGYINIRNTQANCEGCKSKNAANR